MNQLLSLNCTKNALSYLIPGFSGINCDETKKHCLRVMNKHLKTIVVIIQSIIQKKYINACIALYTAGVL